MDIWWTAFRILVTRRRVGIVKRSLLSPLAWTAYVTIPVAGWGWFNGIPLGLIEASAIALVWWVWAAKRELPGTITLTVLVITKLLLGVVLVERGFVARYYANDSFAPPVERSIEFRRTDYTRIDEALSFAGPGRPDLPLHFFNNLRWNYYQPGEPARERLPYSIEWNGALRGDDRVGPRTFYLAAAQGVVVELMIDTRTVASLGGDAAEATGAVSLSPDWHTVTVKASATDGLHRRVEAGEVVEGVRRPLDGTRILTQPVGDLQFVIDAVVRWIARIANAGVLVSLLGLVLMRVRADWRERRVGRLLWIGAIADALLFALHYAGRYALQSGGNDWLVYEHLARAIAFDPLLQQPGVGPGEGGMFYFNVLYPYFVSLTHLAFGDGLLGVVLIQRFLLAAAVAWMTQLTRHLFSPRAGWIALVGGGLLLYVKGGRWTNILLAEPLFAPVLAGWGLLLVRTATGTSVKLAIVAAGALGGIASLIRSSLVLGWPFIVAVWSVAVRGRRLQATVMFVASLLLVYSMLPVRTWIVTGTFAAMPTSGPVTLALANQPSHPLAPVPPARRAVYDRIGLTDLTRGVVEFLIQDPAEFAWNIFRKSIYILGFFGASGMASAANESGTAGVYVVAWVAALLGVIRLLRSPPAQGWALVAIPGVLAMTHFAAHVIFWPNQYADRMLLPFYFLLVPYAALGLEPIVDWVRGHAAQASAVLVAALALAVMLPASPRLFDLITMLTLLSAILACATGPWPHFGPRGWVYAAYSVVLVLRFAIERGSDSQDFRHELLLPLAVFAVARLARVAVARRLMLAALFVGAIVSIFIASRALSGAPGSPLFWVACVCGAAAVAWLARRRPRVGRVTAILAGALTVLALIQPAVQGAHRELPERLGDIRRDVRNLTGGQPGARQELSDDLRVVAEGVRVPYRASVFILSREIAGSLSLLCLFGIWLQATIAARRGRSPALAACYGGLVMMLLMVFAGAGSWRAGAFPGMALALLAGLAETRTEEHTL